MGTRLKPCDGKLDKRPYRVRAGMAVIEGSKTNRKHWASFEEAHDALQRGLVDAIGFVFTEEDPFTVVDLDNAIDPKTGEIGEEASSILASLDTYWETSVSGRGLHIICAAEKPGNRCRTGHVEIYDGHSGARFMVLTGHSQRTDIQPCQEAVDELYKKLFGPEEPASLPQTRTDFAAVSLAREELLKRARNSRTGAKFVKLYDHGDCSDHVSPSEADFALINVLIFWCAGDRNLVVELFESSALYRREKGRHYVGLSVGRALASYRGSYYQPKALREESTPEQRDVLTPYLALLLDAPRWKGQKAAGAYKAYAAMVIAAAELGVVTESGELYIGSDVRTIAEKAGISRQTLSSSSLPYLVEKKLIQWQRGAGKRAGIFVLKTPPAPSDLSIKVSTQYFNGQTYGDGLDALAKLLRMRTGTANTGRSVGLGEMQKVARLGMVAMFIMVTLSAGPRGLTAEELVERTGRRRDHVISTMRVLQERDIVTEPCRGYFTLAEGFWGAYEKELRRSLIVTAERAQRKQHQKERWENQQRLKEGRAQWHAKRDEKVISLDAERRKKLDKEAAFNQPTDDRYLTEEQRAQREQHALMREYDRMSQRCMDRLGEAFRQRDERRAARRREGGGSA
jgi:DNA-binding transcriptional regulator GbsR (MarR family)